MNNPKNRKYTLNKMFEAITEQAIAPMIAILFWFILILMTVMAVAKAKENPLEVSLLGIGVASQSFFAYILWKLSREQLDFTKQATERQHRLDLYPVRRDALRALHELEDVAYNKKALRQTDVDKIRQVAGEISHVFGSEVGAAAFAFEEASIRCKDTEWVKSVIAEQDKRWQHDSQYHARALDDMGSAYMETLNRIELEIPLSEQN